MSEGSEEAAQRLPAVACPWCDPVLGRRFILVDRVRNPESFWLPQSYWRHLNTLHPWACDRVVSFIPAYVALALEPEEDERALIHFGNCKECHVRLLAFLNAGYAKFPGWLGRG